MFPHDESVLACMALPERILVAVQKDAEIKIYVYDTLGNLEVCKKIVSGQKLFKLGV